LGRQLAAGDVHILDQELHQLDAVDAGRLDLARRFGRVMEDRLDRLLRDRAHGDEDVAEAAAGLGLVLHRALNVGFAHQAACNQNIAQSHVGSLPMHHGRGRFLQFGRHGQQWPNAA
jgi:hypothetical protein